MKDSVMGRTPVSPAWVAELESRANGLVGLSTSSSSKYDDFKQWVQGELSIDPAVCYLSDLAKQWTARVGQAVMGFPGLLVLLVQGDSLAEIDHRLASLHAYMTGLEATLVCVGEEGAWRVALVAGSSGVNLFDQLRGARPELAVRDSSALGRVAARTRALSHDAFSALEPIKQGELVWDSLIGLGPLEVDEAIRIAANDLRDEGLVEFERLRRGGGLYNAIEAAISHCSRRGILFDRPRSGVVRATLDNPDEYPREFWRDCVMNVLGAEPGDRDDVVRAAADYAVDVYGLSMQRLRSGGRVDTGIRSALNGLIRLGHVVRLDLRMVRRNPEARSSVLPPGSVKQPDGGVEGDSPPSAPRDENEPSGSPLQEGRSPEQLREMVGDLPVECEAVFVQLLSAPQKTTDELRAAVVTHLKEFEDAFEVHQFLDLGGAEQLAAQCERLLSNWDSLDANGRRLAQAAILYFVDSDEADDDFRIGGLRTDKLIMAAVTSALLRND